MKTDLHGRKDYLNENKCLNFQKHISWVSFQYLNPVQLLFGTGLEPRGIMGQYKGQDIFCISFLVCHLKWSGLNVNPVIELEL